MFVEGQTKTAPTVQLPVPCFNNPPKSCTHINTLAKTQSITNNTFFNKHTNLHTKMAAAPPPTKEDECRPSIWDAAVRFGWGGGFKKRSLHKGHIHRRTEQYMKQIHIALASVGRGKNKPRARRTTTPALPRPRTNTARPRAALTPLPEKHTQPKNAHSAARPSPRTRTNTTRARR
jgi:hypothetical protein